MLVTPLTSSVFFQKSLIWCDSQVVRPRSATPSSPVQIRLAPLKKPWNPSILGLFLLALTNREIGDHVNRQPGKSTTRLIIDHEFHFCYTLRNQL